MTAHPEPWLSSGRRREALPNTSAEEISSNWPALGAEIARNRYGTHIAASQWYATPAMFQPDADTLRLLLHSRTGAMIFRANHALDPEKWLFLDTEATGFIGDAGNLAFLIGLAWWDSGGIQIQQLFMRDAGEEYSILLELARMLRKRPVLVTFNGKSFDWPLLASRFRMTRAIDTPILNAHLDFLHPAREIWKLQIGSTKLGRLEEHVLGAESLGWSRREDIDSAAIPGIYFDYVYGRTQQIEGVFRHNRMDLRGLAALACRIVEILSRNPDSPPQGEGQALELYGLARFFARRHQHIKARRCCERALRLGLPSAIADNAERDLATFIKRELRKARTPSREARRNQLVSAARRSIPR